MSLINKKKPLAFLRAVLMILFIYFILGYVAGYMQQPTTLKDLNTLQQNKIIKTCSLNLSNDVVLSNISQNSLLTNGFYVIKLNNVKLDDFKTNNPHIKYYKFCGSIWLFPAGFYYPIVNNDLSCFYLGNTVYISISEYSYIGNEIKDLFWQIFKEQGNVIRPKSHYIPFYVLIIIFVICFACTIKADNKLKKYLTNNMD